MLMDPMSTNLSSIISLLHRSWNIDRLSSNLLREESKSIMFTLPCLWPQSEYHQIVHSLEGPIYGAPLGVYI